MNPFLLPGQGPATRDSLVQQNPINQAPASFMSAYGRKANHQLASTRKIEKAHRRPTQTDDGRGKRSVRSSSPNGSRSARRRWHNIISARLKTAAARGCPAANKHSSVQDWVNLVEPYYDASVDPARNRVIIPLILGLGCCPRPQQCLWRYAFPAQYRPRRGGTTGDLIRPHRRGHLPPRMRSNRHGTGRSRPTIAVARDDRWGRTYESYSEDPKIAAQYAAAIVEGLEGFGFHLPR